jgi:hypothetical protein
MYDSKLENSKTNNFTAFISSLVRTRSIKIINDISEHAQFEEVTIEIFINSNIKDFDNDTKIEFDFLNKEFKANRLTEF